MDNLLAMLQSADVQQQIASLDELTETKRRDAVPAVMPLLGSHSSVVREMSARFLGQIAPLGDEDAGNHLLAALNDPDELTRAEVVTALGLLCYTPALAPLHALARNDPAWVVRVAALEALAAFGKDESFPIYVAALESDPSALVQRYAADAIRVTASPQRLDEIARLAVAQRNEPINAIHLLLAAYKLGRADEFEAIRKLLAAEDDVEDMFYLIHVLASAYTEQLPPHVIADIPALMQAVDARAKRLPDAEAYCEELKGQLSEILQGKIIPSDRQCC